MSHYLLLGAGFSRNWGGWLASEAFEYLLGCAEVQRSEVLRALLWKHQERGGFEDALAEVQGQYIGDSKTFEGTLVAFQSSIGRMFEDMNKALFEHANWDPGRRLTHFLAKFDAIFTLNQDLLMEAHYCPVVELLDPRGWQGCVLPGMRPEWSDDPLHHRSWARARWSVENDGKFAIDKRLQPVFKLHGSSNWFGSENRALLVMGGGKAREIKSSPILSAYATEFAQRVSSGGRLMVIGYGFRDQHINQAIFEGAQKGLEMFIVDPRGADLAIELNTTKKRAHIAFETDLEQCFRNCLIGASRRSLIETFHSEGAEYSKIARFFD